MREGRYWYNFQPCSFIWFCVMPRFAIPSWRHTCWRGGGRCDATRRHFQVLGGGGTGVWFTIQQFIVSCTHLTERHVGAPAATQCDVIISCDKTWLNLMCGERVLRAQKHSFPRTASLWHFRCCSCFFWRFAFFVRLFTLFSPTARRLYRLLVISKTSKTRLRKK